MNRKSIFRFGLLGFFLMWGISALAAVTPRGEPAMQATMLPGDTTPAAPAGTADAVIPVTGEAQSVVGIFSVYAIFGVGALCLIFGLLNAANKRTVLDAHRKDPPDQS